MSGLWERHFIHHRQPKAFGSHHGDVPIIVMNTAMVHAMTTADPATRIRLRAWMRANLGRD